MPRFFAYAAAYACHFRHADIDADAARRFAAITPQPVIAAADMLTPAIAFDMPAALT